MIYVVVKKGFTYPPEVTLVTYREIKDEAEKERKKMMDSRRLGKDYCSYEVIEVGR